MRDVSLKLVHAVYDGSRVDLTFKSSFFCIVIMFIKRILILRSDRDMITHTHVIVRLLSFYDYFSDKEKWPDDIHISISTSDAASLINILQSSNISPQGNEPLITAILDYEFNRANPKGIK